MFLPLVLSWKRECVLTRMLASCMKWPANKELMVLFNLFLQIEPGSVAYLDGRLTLCDVVLKV